MENNNTVKYCLTDPDMSIWAVRVDRYGYQLVESDIKWERVVIYTHNTFRSLSSYKITSLRALPAVCELANISQTVLQSLRTDGFAHRSEHIQGPAVSEANEGLLE